jgi:glycerol-3-phosphate dehydrogenase
MSASHRNSQFDIAVVGAGVIGCAIARQFTLEGARVVVIEKAPDILDGASKANSAILHTGFDAPPGSIEASCVAAGHAEYLKIHERLGLPLIKSGALVIAWTEGEEQRLPMLMERARENGVEDIQLLSAGQTRELEPELADHVKASFLVPREYLIDPWSAPYGYLLQGLANGAVIKRNCEVKGGRFDGVRWKLDTVQGQISATTVINAAGLYGDIIDQKLTGRTRFSIKPRKGQFIVYDKPASTLAKHILLPVPNEVTKGVVICRTAYGNLLVGPTAEAQDDRVNAALSETAMAALRQRGEEILPALADHDVTAVYAGLRPATEFKDYQIHAYEGLNYITVGGIRSTGLSSALGTAKLIYQRYLESGEAFQPPATVQWPRVRNIAENYPRDWQCEGNKGIVCHCELVTRREINEALEGPLAVRSIGGLKRRTRATMGRCQGFYCSAELAKMTQPYFDAAGSTVRSHAGAN